LERSRSNPVLGPEDPSYNDMARIMSEVLVKPVRFQQIPDDAFKARMLQNGMSEAMAQGALDMWRAYNQGLDTAEPRTPSWNWMSAPSARLRADYREEILLYP
jgi:hypothetical protein